MSEDNEAPEECGAPYDTKEGICDRTATMPDSRCKYHSDHDTDMDKYWARTMDHGLYMERSKYFNEQDKIDQKWIDCVAEDLLDKSRYTEEDLAMVEKCRQIAIDMHQKRTADGYVAEHGLTQEKTVGFHEAYGEITETQENVLMITKDRLSRESRLAMKDLGIMDEKDDGSNEAKAVIEQLSSAVE